MLAIEVLVILMVVITAATVISYITFKLLVSSSSVSEKQTCKLSFAASATLAKLYDKSHGLVDTPPVVDCERQELVIDYDKTVRVGSRIDDAKVKNKILKAMLDCWDMTGSGTLDPSKSGGWIYSNNQIYCLICSELSFSPKFQKEAKKQNYVLKGLLYYAATKRLPGQTQTLYEHIGGQSVGTGLNLISLKKADERYSYAFDVPYIIFWRMGVFKKSTSSKVFSAIGKAFSTV